MPAVTKVTSSAVRTNGKPLSVIDRIGPIDFSGEQGISLLVYGQSGTGKTSFVGTFPGPILFAVCSGSFRPGELRSLNSPELREKIQQVTLHHSSELRELIKHVKDTRRYKTFVLDHVSGLQDLTLKEIMGLSELPAQKYFGFAKRDDYAQSTSQCKEYLRGMLNLTDFCNIVIVGQERVFNGSSEEGGGSADSDIISASIGVGVTPALAGWLQPAVDYTVQAYRRGRFETKVVKIAGKQPQEKKIRVKGVDFCIRTEPHDVIATKFRLPKGMPLPECIVDPTYDKLVAVLRGEQV